MSEESEKPKVEEGKTEEIEEETTEEKTAEPQKAEVKKVKKQEKGSFSYYKIGEEGLTRLRPFCERCGSGYFMADHGDRFTCGHCGFTRYKQNQQ